MFELCGIATNDAPVAADVCSSQVQIAIARVGAPLPPGERGEFAWLVVALRGGDLVVPGLARDRSEQGRELFP
jgi:hypothetical protein